MELLLSISLKRKIFLTLTALSSIYLEVGDINILLERICMCLSTEKVTGRTPMQWSIWTKQNFVRLHT